MPELPEVETVRRTLKKVIVNRFVRKARVLEKKIIHQESLPIKSVSKKRIVAIHRRAKLLILDLSGGYSLVIHLKMTGQLIYQSAFGGVAIGGHPIEGGAVGLPNKFTRVILELNKGDKLYFNDIRKFGYFRLLMTHKLPEMFNRLKLGPEPLDNKVTFRRFQKMLKKRPRSQIKNILLDQSVISGLGNIYADEVNYQAGIKPTRRAKSLKVSEQKKIFQAIPDILRLAIKKRGTTIQDYRDSFGQPGGMQKYLKVYQRTGQPCFRCGHVIIRKKIGSRSAHYCKHCQK
ncbi:MAG: DNA-formamidopyrimidine glycosylase [bacterium]